MSQAVAKTDEAGTITNSAEQNQYLTFVLNDELFALGILSIKEIIEFGKLTTVPMMPPYIAGVINLRGSVVPVVDISVRFGREQTQVARRTCIVIVEVQCDEQAMEIGIIVDAVNEVVEIAPTEIEPPPPFGAKIRSDFIAGMGKREEGFVIILNVEGVLSIDELAALDSLAEPAQPA